MVTSADIGYTFCLLEWLDLGRISKPGPVPAIGEGEVREIQIGLPTLSEQTGIVRFLEKTAAIVDDGVANVRCEISLLREYRARLIADVVTGKLDVREAAAALPEVDPIAAYDKADDPFDAGAAPAFDVEEPRVDVVG